MNIVDQIRPFLEPKSIAFVGISRRTGPESMNAMESVLEQNYEGKLYPVNPHTDKILGMKAYSSVTQIPDSVDLAVILTPRDATPNVVRECTENGIKSIVVIGQGFADGIDDEGKRLQNEIVTIARDGGARILGPNTLGTANAFANFSLSFARQINMERIPVGIISQSGLFFGRINELNMVGKGIDVGNSCDVDVADCLEYFEADPETKVIALHIEGIRNGKKFIEIAKRVAQNKPIIVLKTGRTEQASKAAQSHSGTLIGKDEVWDAIFKQCGLIRAESIDEMSDLVKTFSYKPIIKGRNTGIISFSGGMGIITLDACEKYGLNIVNLSPETRQKIYELAPPWLGVGNPVDLWPAIMMSKRPLGEPFNDGMHIIMGDPRINSAILILAAWAERINPSLTDTLSEVADAFPDKAMILCPYEGWMYDVSRKELEDKLHKTGNILVLPTSDRAAKALSRVAEYSEFRSNSEH